MPTKLSGTVRPKTFDTKPWYPLLYIKISDTTIFLKHGRDAHEFIQLCKTKVFRRKNMILPFFIRKNFSKQELLSKTVGVVYKIFRQAETKNFRQKNVIPLIMNEVFRYPKSSETLKGCPGYVFGNVRPYFFDERWWYPYHAKIFRYPKLSELLKGYPQNISALWDLKFLTENVIPPIIHKFFRYHNFCKTMQGSSWNFSARWDQSFSRE